MSPPGRMVAVAVWTVLAALAGCAGEDDGGAPGPAPSDLLGQVRLIAPARDGFGAVNDTIAVEDADGIMVILFGEILAARAAIPVPLDTTFTTGGLFGFWDLPAADYHVEARVRDGAQAESEVVTLAGADTTLPEPLGVTTSPELRLYPNPFPADHGVGLEFETAVDDTATFRAMTLSGQEVWYARVAVVPSEYTHVHWGGGAVLDTLPAGPYWVVAEWSEGTLQGLVVMER